MDTLFQSIKNNTITDEDVYYYIRNLALRATFESSHIGLDQIKSAGGLRMIKNTEIISGIQQYERMINSIEKLENVRERTLEQARFKMAVVFDPSISYEMLSNQGEGIMRFKRPKKADAIFLNNRTAVKELLNLVTFGLNTNKYLNNRLSELKKIGLRLDNAIVKEYGEKFE
jgi:DNA integrity scanning protein DisA with diadenylate cyclase activity